MVKINSITGGEAGIPNLQQGRAQLVAGNYVSFILAQMAGKFGKKPVNLRIIAAGAEIQPGTEDLFQVMPSSKFQTVASPVGARQDRHQHRARHRRPHARRDPAEKRLQGEAISGK